MQEIKTINLNMKLTFGRLIFRCFKLWLIILNSKINLKNQNFGIEKSIFILFRLSYAILNNKKAFTRNV